MSLFAIALTFWLLLWLPIQHSQESGNRASAAPAGGSAQGKSIFVARCAKCHDDSGNKKLADGTTLLARLAQSQDPEARLGTRLKNPQERHQVMMYLRPMLDQFATPATAKPH